MSTATAQQTETKASVELVKTESKLVTEQGVTSIADTVVQKIAGLAAREVSGVHALGGGAARAMSALRERIPGASASAGQGVSVEVGEKQAAVDLQLVVEYGVGIADLSRAVRRNVITALERMTGLEVVEVNIHIHDLHLPEEDSAPAPARVS
ncbi:Asp23/Gls24 family envelope stress response protein [Amycolatopsis sp. 195334CR]|uniref:Asp23/Gls24 family envelope stress response protein n=1 Tax=Amycolatopsis sp. 195334CR TaxID=2814588 RepID=UPI001A8E7DA3|nr:Asp23/Gls24 family envelope stress response protein [Amycolatopsis sp. 195334CR]MBN6042065.1 Asp23/Gls24 family envelope stress response protein [Amycolatopsis sp. 195334CR]